MLALAPGKNSKRGTTNNPANPYEVKETALFRCHLTNLRPAINVTTHTYTNYTERPSKHGPGDGTGHAPRARVVMAEAGCRG